MSDVTTPTAIDDARDVGAWGQAVSLAFKFLLFAAVAIAVGWLVSNVRQVPPDNQAVVVRFGKLARLHGPGLLFALPRPLETVTMIPAGARQIQLKIDAYTAGVPKDSNNNTLGFDISDKPRLNSAFLLTGDSSVIHLDAQLFYQVNDPEAYMVAADHIPAALQRLFIASAVDVIGARDLDAILVARPENASKTGQAARRERLRADLLSAVNNRLLKLAEQDASLGVTISRIDLVPSIPRGAHDAFDSVLAVTQDSERTIAAAQTNKEITAQKADSDKDRITSDATAKAEENVSKAQVATASITALGNNTKDMSRGMQMSRLYYDRIGPILKKAARVQIVSPEGKVVSPGGK